MVLVASLHLFGTNQTDKYKNSLKRTFALIDDIPTIDTVVPGNSELRRFIHQAHVIYYQIAGEDVLITRILHSRQQTDGWSNEE